MPLSLAYCAPPQAAITKKKKRIYMIHVVARKILSSQDSRVATQKLVNLNNIT